MRDAVTTKLQPMFVCGAVHSKDVSTLLCSALTGISRPAQEGPYATSQFRPRFLAGAMAAASFVFVLVV